MRWTQAAEHRVVPLVAGRPFADHQLRLLRSQGFRRVVMCVGHLGEQIAEFVGTGERYGLSVTYVFDGPVQRGTAGAIRAALPHLEGTFAVEYGDTYLRAPVKEIAAHFMASGKRGLMTVYRNDNALEPSNVVLEDGAIVLYDKRRRDPRMRHIDFGLSFFRDDAFHLVPENSSYDLADLFVHLVERGELATFEVPDRFYEIGTPQALADTDRLLSLELSPHGP